MSFSQAAALVALLCSFSSSRALAQEEVKPIPQEPTAEERAAARKDEPQQADGGTAAPEAPKDGPKISLPEAPLKTVPQEPTPEERAAARGGEAQPGEPVTAAEWARRQREKAGLPVGAEPLPESVAAAPEKPSDKPAASEPPREAARDLSVGFGSPAVDAPGGLAGASAAPRHLLEISGYAILGASFTQSDPNLLYVGRNNGFTLADARLEVTARPAATLWLFLSLDGAVAAVNPNNPAQGTRQVQLKDAYGIWAPGNHLRVQAGQFKAPQSVEELLEETDIKFASRSILSAGVDGTHGYVQGPLSLGRQLGAGIGTDRVELAGGGLTTQLAVMNGNGDNQLYNDAPYPSFMARTAYDRAGVSVGIYGSFQPRARGDQPLVYRDNVFAAGADVLFNRGPLHAMVLAGWQHTRHVSSQQPDETGLGVSGEVAYRFGIIEPAARVTYFSPSDLVPVAALLYETIGLNFYVPGAPGRLTIDYTHRGEQSGRDLSNDGVDLSAQVRF